MKINRHYKEVGFTHLINVLVAIFLITLPTYTEAAKSIFYILAIISLGYSVKYFNKYKQIDTLLKFLFISILLYIAWTFFTFYINGSPGRGKSFIWNRQFYLVIIIPLYLLFTSIEIHKRIILISLTISIVIAFAISLNDIDTDYGRAHGGMHPILFGSIILCMSMYVLICSINNTNLLLRAGSISIFIIGLTIVIWTQSRGVWLAIPFLLLPLIVSTLRKHTTKYQILFYTIASVIMIATMQHPIISNQLTRTINSLSSYYTTTEINDKAKETSLGNRLEMWKASWNMFIENPIIGVGTGAYKSTAKENSDRYGVGRGAYAFYHPHNQYLSILSLKGLPGLIMFLSFVVTPLLYNYKNRHTNNSKDESTMIIVLTIAYLLFGLTDVPFEGKATIIFYSVFIAILLSHISNQAGKRNANIVQTNP